MRRPITVYNSLSRKKEPFEEIEKDFVGMYVCGPTVYSDVHLGNCRTFMGFDIIYRYLLSLGYKVRYIRNITDVGHLLDDGEDRIAKGALAEKLEPMEVVQKYSNGFHFIMDMLNCLKPNIEPRATGHISEQIEAVKKILENDLAYVENGSVYFDTQKFDSGSDLYGALSGRKIDELMAESRADLKNQDEKRHPSDFAIWVRASEDHIMHWPSPWAEGFPGWHLECSVMSTKYLGKHFDIHGGGNDLKFPHHENEIAQNYGIYQCAPANYWLHTNMLLMNGRKMSKSDGNTISPEELFSGQSDHMRKAYTPMVFRFFSLQSHYRSTMDLTDEALFAAEKGYNRLMDGYKTLKSLDANVEVGSMDDEIRKLMDRVHAEMADDFNTPRTLAALFEIVPKINGLKEGLFDDGSISAKVLNDLKSLFKSMIEDIFGLQGESEVNGENNSLNTVMNLLIDIRQQAREDKDWALSDKIRDKLAEGNIQLKDGKDGTSWVYQ